MTEQLQLYLHGKYNTITLRTIELTAKCAFQPIYAQMITNSATLACAGQRGSNLDGVFFLGGGGGRGEI